MHRRHAALGSLVMTAVVVTGCSGSSTSPSESTPPPAPPPSATLRAPAVVGLTAMPTGTATLTWDSNTSRISVQIQAIGFTPRSSHAMHLHPGSCADPDPAPSIAFPDLVADARGAVLQTVVSGKAPAGIPPGFHLSIHLAPDRQLGAPDDVAATRVACADIPSGTPAAGPAVVPLLAPARQQNTPGATATVRYDAAAHTVRTEITASGLLPDSAHAAHIHAGSCAAQGADVYPLPDIQSDGAGNATSAATITGVMSAPPATGWYVDVHLGSSDRIRGSDNSPALLFAPILCGDIRAGG
ncbi:CHRD domain-containing protein [Rhodococcus sp. NPDC059234]|uniref:CHRD domain-containing protein n=1 Tax=Rhodococcus sp. NPDC059234 TaxID=3346781 RepID=UPI00366D6BB9